MKDSSLKGQRFHLLNLQFCSCNKASYFKNKNDMYNLYFKTISCFCSKQQIFKIHLLRVPRRVHGHWASIFVSSTSGQVHFAAEWACIYGICTRILFDCLIAEGKHRVGFEGDDSRGTATDLLFSVREKERREYINEKQKLLSLTGIIFFNQQPIAECCCQARVHASHRIWILSRLLFRMRIVFDPRYSLN